MMKRVRVVKVIVQPVLVIDDGETLQEFNQDPITIPAAEWPTYSSERFPGELEAFEQALNAEQSPE